MLFLFVFFYLLFIQDVEHVRFFFCFHVFFQPWLKSTIRSMERGSPAFSRDRIDDTLGEYYVFYHATRDALSNEDS